MKRPGIDLYWLPLGAGGWFVRLNGKAYEALAAARERRRRADLYHSALIVTMPEARFAIESAPIPDGDSAARGVVAGGAVGHRALGRFRVFAHAHGRLAGTPGWLLAREQRAPLVAKERVA